MKTFTTLHFWSYHPALKIDIQMVQTYAFFLERLFKRHCGAILTALMQIPFLNNVSFVIVVFFFLSFPVHNLEFCPEESVRAVQKDSQLLFSHYLPCTGKTHEFTKFLFAGTCSLQSYGETSQV